MDPSLLPRVPPGASDGELVVICAAVAEHGAALCRVFGTPEQVAWVDGALDLVWAAASGEAVEDECAEALDEVELAIDEEEADTEDPAFFADQSVALVGLALESVLRPSVDKAEDALEELRSSLSSFDFKLSGAQVVVVKYGQPRPPPGPLEQSEITAQRDVLAQLASTVDESRRGVVPPSVVARIRESAEAFAAELAGSVEQAAVLLRDWEA
ncbi:hypothetical protein ALI22I_14505 [Saccharothrix sp. ALI-22-I]|uniref:hypothetical protein n=1 Tax=Saccharothrix sp. ALI-22-I TaxID=1933778 RepID=UPI0009C647C3|nr:hypothetical protein [Saccharothrix sp. ALI-22-I]ONI89706.1 hypothetical protein ALI22I_14505 [Saccharothrix sp. ALI-22-I]